MSAAGLLSALGLSLGLTLLLEEAFALATGLALRRHRPPRDYLLVALVNLATNPPLVLVVHLIAWHARGVLLPAVVLLEIAAVLAEWVFYRRARRSFKRPLVFSAAANGFSLGLGALITALF